jgi:hypothetical protein
MAYGIISVPSSLMSSQKRTSLNNITESTLTNKLKATYEIKMLSHNVKTIGTKILKPSSFLKSSLRTSASPATRHFSVAFGGDQNNSSEHIQTTINTFSAKPRRAPVLESPNAHILSTISVPVNNKEAQVKEQRQFSALGPDLTEKLRAEFEVRRLRNDRFLINTF